MEAALTLSVIVAAGAGLLSFLSPCVLPLVPSYLAYVAGVSFADLRDRPSPSVRLAVVLNALGFIAGFSLIFVAMGASVSLLGEWVITNRRLFQQVGGSLVILFGLYLLGILRLPFLMRQVQLPLSNRPGGILGSLVVGVTFASGWTPCVGPVLGSILTLAGTSQTLGQGMTLLGAYSAGLAVPFLASALAVGQFLRFFTRFKRFLPWVDRVAGLILIGVGVLLVMNYMAYLNAYFISLTPQWLLKRL
ncbi:MAG: cytochrome c biogenesis protein CcdA [Candidatus Rokubacteria bacterium]|nr:cytochrome c biogenesis protein CcdA [Candidatus Rokubacteria bacterium]